MPRDFDSIRPKGNSRRAAYVVFEGRKPGVYATWAEAEAQVHQYSWAKHSGYDSKDEAYLAFESYQESKGIRTKTRSNRQEESPRCRAAKRRQSSKKDDSPPWDID